MNTNQTAAARQEARAEHRRAEIEAARARLDPLTQLGNRQALVEAFDALPLHAAVIVIDLDHFKLINDRYGHDAGDATLVEVAWAIRAALRPGDSCARMGGEEFCVVLAEIGTDGQLAEITEGLRKAVELVRPIGFPLINVTASFGALRVPAGVRMSDALRSADQATYRAKTNGRNRVELSIYRAA